MSKTLTSVLCGLALTGAVGTTAAVLRSTPERSSAHFVSRGAPSEQILKQHPALRDMAAANQVCDNLLTGSNNQMRSLPFKAPVAKAAAPLHFFGNIVYQNNWDSRYNAYGAYNILVGDELSSDLILKGSSSTMYSNAGAIRLGDLFYTANWGSSFGGVEVDVRVYDLTTGTRKSYIELYGVGYIATDFAKHDESGTIYGAFYNDQGNGYELCTVVFDENAKYTPIKTVLGPVARMIVALGVTSDQRIYGICDDGCFYEFDNKTAEARLIADTGVKVASANGVLPQSGTIDQYNDKFYWACVNGDKESKFYLVNLNDGHVEEIANSPLQDRIYGLSAMAHAAEDKAPNSLTDFAVAFNGNSLSGNVTFTYPEDTFDGSALGHDLQWTILANGNELKTGNATPGQSVTVPVTVSGGMNTFEAYAFNGVGKSPYSSIDVWVGEDIPVVKSANFEYMNNTATVTWECSDKGIHDGWVSSIKFDVVRMPDETKVASGISDKKFSEKLTSDIPLANYYYVITPSNGELTGKSFSTNKHQIGQSLTPPFSETFDDRESTDLFILGNEWTWDYNENNGNGFLVWEESSYPGAEGPVADEWALTPEIKVEAGATYEISFCTYAPYGDKFEVFYGEGTDPSKYMVLLPATSGKYSSAMNDPHVLTLEATKNQNIRLGFHHSGRKEMFLRVDNLSISAPRHANAPAKIGQYTITPDSKGALFADFTITAPTLTQGGSPLTTNVDINIYESGKLVAEIENLKPGQEYKWTYTASRNGIHNFKLEPSSEDGIGESIQVDAFIGVDRPLPPFSRLIDKGSYLQLEWTPVETGASGNFVNPADFTYSIYQPEANGSISSKPLISGLTGTTYDINLDPSKGNQGFLSLLMTATNSAGESDLRYTEQFLVGKPYDLPILEHFDGNGNALWVKESNSLNFDISTSHCSDDDGYSMCYGILQGTLDDALMSSGKISLKYANPVISFDYIVNYGNAIEIYKLSSDGKSSLIGTADEEGGGSDGWKSATFTIPATDAEDYCRIRIVFKNNSGPMNFMFVDNIRIFNQINKDLSIESTVSPSTINIGESCVMTSTVTNNGSEKSGKFTIDYYVNDKMTYSKEYDPVESGKSITVNYSYVSTPADCGDLNILAFINYPDDQDSDNNESLVNVTVLESHVSAPVKLKGTLLGDETVKLDWEAPTEFMTYKATEDFESYSPCSIVNLGEWKLVDADGRATIGLSEGDFPNNGAAMAYMVFNPRYIGVPEGNTEANPHSGAQYLVSFATILNNPDDHNDDWLISPALSGKPQTISFYSKQMITNFGAEDVEVLYSTTGREIEDFKLLKEIKVSGASSWSKYEVDLPEGALYFAIRVVTPKGHMLLLDDVTYEKGSCKTITGYNIYRNNEKIGSVNGLEKTFIDQEPIDKNLYNVSAVYATGEESDFSNGIEIETSRENVIEIESDKEYEIYTIDGIVLTRFGHEIMNLPRGIYIINGHKVTIR